MPPTDGNDESAAAARKDAEQRANELTKSDAIALIVEVEKKARKELNVRVEASSASGTLSAPFLASTGEDKGASMFLLH